MLNKYMRKDSIVTAIQFLSSEDAKFIAATFTEASYHQGVLTVMLFGSPVILLPGDWVVERPNKEITVVSDGAFRTAYDPYVTRPANWLDRF